MEIHFPRLQLTFVNKFTNAILLDTYTAKILVKQLHITMNNFEGQEFIVFLFDSTTEIETGISGKRKRKA
jgi:hypothetical protein